MPLQNFYIFKCRLNKAAREKKRRFMYKRTKIAGIWFALADAAGAAIGIYILRDFSSFFNWLIGFIDLPSVSMPTEFFVAFGLVMLGGVIGVFITALTSLWALLFVWSVAVIIKGIKPKADGAYGDKVFGTIVFFYSQSSVAWSALLIALLIAAIVGFNAAPIFLFIYCAFALAVIITGLIFATGGIAKKKKT
jgi:hypothetical protein